MNARNAIRVRLLLLPGAILLAATLAFGGRRAPVTTHPPSGPVPAPVPVPVPILYSTDLFHPHDDPDDHFDLATLYAIPGLELRGIVLDQGDKQRQRPGTIPVSQMNALTGRRIPTALGLGSKLTSPTDTAIGQPEEFQGGVRMILDTLRAATSRVDLIAVGSVRDVTAAYNREPDLLRARAGRVLVFIGEASNPGFREYNVELDPHAYVGLMRSGLDVHWVPCFDGGLWKNEGHASFWQVSHRDVLERAPPELIQFFVYALEREMADPLRFVRQSVNPVRRENLFRTDRNLWCTAVFASLTRQPAAPAHGEPFGFEPVDITITDGAVVEYPGSPSPGSHRIWRFRVLDRAAYASRMTQATADLLTRFPVLRP